MKASVLFGAGWEDDSLEVLWRDADRAFCRLWRDDAEGETHAFIPIPSGAEHPTLESVNRLTHEYELQSFLDSAWALRPLELVRERGQTMLVVDYTRRRASRSPRPAADGDRAVPPTRRGAVRRSRSAPRMRADSQGSQARQCARRLRNGRVRLTGFGIASRLPRERQSPEPPEFIAGTLAYMAPEQTGRVNRSIDSRSDLYSLGVTFYEMLTGSLPFTASDPMEWVHCHIARQPAAPSERLTSVPAAVSAITMKLLAKTGRGAVSDSGGR